jgi:hypothetical protein
MDWILDHLQVVIAIAGVIAYWLTARSKQKAAEKTDYNGGGTPGTLPGGGRAMREGQQAMEQAEATRRIQEEIRRKIAERAGNAGGVRTVQSLPTPPPMPARRRESELAREVRREETERDAAAVLERQRALMDQLAALKARKAAEGVETKAVWNVDTTAATPVRTSARVGEEVSLLAELRNARSLRKAIVLREVLGTPVGLR